MPDNEDKFDFLEKILKLEPPPSEYGFSLPEPLSELQQRILATKEKIRDSEIFVNGKLKVGTEGKGNPLPIADVDKFCLELAVAIELDADRQDPAKERERIEKEYSQLESAFLKFIFNLFYRQGQAPGKTILSNQKKKIKKVPRIWGEIEELKQWALGQIPDSPPGKATPDLRDALAEVFLLHFPEISHLTLVERLDELAIEFPLNITHTTPDALYKWLLRNRQRKAKNRRTVEDLLRKLSEKSPS